MSLLPAWRRVGQTISVLVLLGTGFLVGAAVRDTTARAEVRPGKAATSFKSGAQRSELKLGEIAVTLKSIDTRLARLEALAARVLDKDEDATPRPGGARR